MPTERSDAINIATVLASKGAIFHHRADLVGRPQRVTMVLCSLVYGSDRNSGGIENMKINNRV